MKTETVLGEAVDSGNNFLWKGTIVGSLQTLVLKRIPQQSYWLVKLVILAMALKV